MNNSPKRAAAVTATLLMAGALFGALAAMAGAMIAVTITHGVGDALDVLGYAGIAGGFLGALLLPATSWLLLRRVPLGLSWIGSMVGTVAGGAAGWIVAYATDGHPLFIPIGAAIAGFFLAVLGLRMRFPASRERVRVSGPAGV